VIAANRALLMSLVATNIFGQNTPAIAATEAQYAEMWAHDATAMYGYAGTSAAATTLTSFATPPQTTNPGGVGNQAAAANQATGTGGLAQLLSAVPQTLQHLASAGPSGPINQINQLLLTLNNSGPIQGAVKTEAFLQNTVFNRFILILPQAPGLAIAPIFSTIEEAGYAAADHVAAVSAPAAAVDAVSGGAPSAATLAGSYGGGAGVSAGLGRAASVGGLSVPQSWATASPAVRLAATALPADELGAWTGSAAPGGTFNGMCPMGGVVNAPRNGEPRSRADARLKVIAQMPGERGVGGNTPGRWVYPDQHAAHDARALSERDRDDLITLRKELAELAMERDAAARLIKEAIRR
jgi:PPE-repeat protein